MVEQSLELRRIVSKTVRCEYLLSVPENSGDGREQRPLLLFLHGAGERGEDLALVRKHWPVKAVEKGQAFPFIVLAPQCLPGRWWHPDELMALLDEVVALQPVDMDRIHITGLSMGGFGAWALAIAEPDRFAAIAPICGGGVPYVAERIKDLPVWAFHGAKDSVVPLYESERMIEALRACGGNPKLTVYPDAEHDSWTETYANPELYAWLLQHRRSDRS